MYKMVLQDVEECPKKARKLWCYKFTELQKSLFVQARYHSGGQMPLSTASWNSRCSCGSGFLLLDVFSRKPLWSKNKTIHGLKDPHEYSSRIYPLCWQYLTQDIWEVHRLYEVSTFTWQLPSDDCWFLCFPSLSISTSMDVGYLISLLL